MPSWKKVILSGSSAALTSVTATAGFTGSLSGSALTAITASHALTASFVTTLNQNVLITGSLTVGATALGASENTLTLGPKDNSQEGGQIMLQAPGGTYTSASMWDNYTNLTRLLRGSNAGSDAVVAQFNMHTKQMQLPAYNNVSAFTGSAAAFLAVDSSGNLITTSSAGGGGSVTINNNVDNYLITATGTINTLNGESNLQFNGSSLTVTGQITSSGAIISLANGAMYFRGGDDAEFWDINLANHVGIYGQQDQGIASIKLGSGGGIISGRSGSIGINTTNPTSASLTINGNVWATSFTGSLLGTATTASYVLNAVSSSFASTASYVLQAVSASFASTASFVNPLNQNVIVTGSVNISQNITASRAYFSSSNGTSNGPTLTVYGSGSAQPVLTVQGSQGELFSVTDSLSGSLYSVNDISGLPILEVFSDSTILMGNYQDPMLITTTKIVQTNSGSFTVYSLPTASYDTAFFEYSIKSGSNARAGTIMAIQAGSSVNFTETTTTDIGNTTAVSFTVLVSGSNLALTGSSTTGSWTIKTIVRSI